MLCLNLDNPRLACSRSAAAAAAIMACAISPAAIGQLCAVGSGASITAGPAVAAGQPLQAAFTISAPGAGGCSVMVESVRIWLPDNLPDSPDACEATNGIELPVSGVILNPGEFLRLTCVDSPMANCGESAEVNCELLMPEMCYLADPADAVAGSLLFSACWQGTALPGGEPVQAGMDDAALLVSPSVAIAVSADTDVVCPASPTSVTFNIQLSSTLSDVAIENIVVTDEAGAKVERGNDAPGNNDDLLEPGEVWQLSCVHDVQGEFEGQFSVVGQDVLALSAVEASATIVLAATCPTDLSCDGHIGAADLAVLLAAWGSVSEHPADFDQNASVGPEDLAVLLSSWGACAP